MSMPAICRKKHPAYRVLHADKQHLHTVIRAMRSRDKVEIALAELHWGQGLSPEASISRAFLSSSLRWALLHKGKCIAIAGVAPLRQREEEHNLAGAASMLGCPWFAATPAIHQAGRLLHQLGPVYARRMAQAYPILFNIAGIPAQEQHPKQAPLLRWLQHCGFSLSTEPLRILGGGLWRFYPFIMNSTVNHTTQEQHNVHQSQHSNVSSYSGYGRCPRSECQSGQQK